MEGVVGIVLLVLQLAAFLLARLMDDLSWTDWNVADQTAVFEGVGVAAMSLCAICQILRKRHLQGWWKLLLVRSQAKFVISWAITGTVIMLFFNIFGCHPTVEEHSKLGLTTRECALNVVHILLTEFNFSLICNTKAHRAELIVYEAVLFGEIIYNGNLFLRFIDELEHIQKDYSILLVSLLISNQMLMMDLIFRAAYQDREREEEEEEKMLGHVKPLQHEDSSLAIDPNPAFSIEPNPITNVINPSPDPKINAQLPTSINELTSIPNLPQPQ